MTVSLLLSCALCARFGYTPRLLGDKFIAADRCVLALPFPVSALLAFKRAIYQDPLSKLSDWNSKDEDPCAWSGVRCSGLNNRVVAL